jgi:hypothetical protein
MRRLLTILIVLFFFHEGHSQLMVLAHAGPDTITCAGDSVQIGGNPISSNTTPPITISWTPNYNISNASAANPMVFPNVTTMYYLSVTDANGRSGKDSVLVTAHVPGSVSLSALPSVCFKDDPITLTQGRPIGGIYKSKGTVDSVSFDSYYSGIGSHLVTYVYEDPYCHVLDSASNSLFVGILSTITYSLSMDTICKGDTAFVVLNSSADHYIWRSTYNTQLVSKGDSASLWPDSTYFYRVIGVDSIGCTDSTVIRLEVIDCSTGLESSLKQSSFRIYPNPVKDILRFESVIKYTDLTLLIRNLQGQTVLSENDVVLSQPIDLSQLKVGVYYLHIYDDTGIILFKSRLLKIDN